MKRPQSVPGFKDWLTNESSGSSYDNLSFGSSKNLYATIANWGGAHAVRYKLRLMRNNYENKIQKLIRDYYMMTEKSQSEFLKLKSKVLKESTNPEDEPANLNDPNSTADQSDNTNTTTTTNSDKPEEVKTDTTSSAGISDGDISKEEAGDVTPQKTDAERKEELFNNYIRGENGDKISTFDKLLTEFKAIKGTDPDKVHAQIIKHLEKIKPVADDILDQRNAMLEELGIVYPFFRRQMEAKIKNLQERVGEVISALTYEDVIEKAKVYWGDIVSIINSKYDDIFFNLEQNKRFRMSGDDAVPVESGDLIAPVSGAEVVGKNNRDELKTMIKDITENHPLWKNNVLLTEPAKHNENSKQLFKAIISEELKSEGETTFSLNYFLFLCLWNDNLYYIFQILCKDNKSYYLFFDLTKNEHEIISISNDLLTKIELGGVANKNNIIFDIHQPISLEANSKGLYTTNMKFYCSELSDSNYTSYNKKMIPILIQGKSYLQDFIIQHKGKDIFNSNACQANKN